MTIRRVGRRERGFPELLAAIHDPPSELHVRGEGELRIFSEPAVAIVGARACSSFVSGLARGIDGEAHRGALDAGGITCAVLGCGIDRDYPAAHAELARRICERGLILSEYPAGVEPAPWRFPARNRIIAGLCRATVVVEARERSGALITADFALEDGREVLAVPGEITSALSIGTNALIRLGATPVTRTEDVLEAFGLERTPSTRAPVGATAEALLGALRDASLTADELGRASRVDAADVSAALLELELARLITQEDGVYRASV
jgi:DNA processing protein